MDALLFFSSYLYLCPQILSHAYQLYDAVMLYAYGLSQVLSEGGSFLDGRAIISKLFGHRYKSK